MQIEVIETADGSKTLYVPELKEHYHSVNGAVQESDHVFIQAGLSQLSKPEIKIFELGFGTGLNALLSLDFAIENKKKIIYTAIERDPLSDEIISRLDYFRFIKNSDQAESMFSKLHLAPWEEETVIVPGFILEKRHTTLEEYDPEYQFDLIFYDAFAPSVQPELWSEEILRKATSWMNSGAFFVTYCARGEVRRILQKCGLSVERLPGPPGKREMLRAIKKA